MRFVVAIGFLAGCDAIFGLSREPKPIDAAIDSPPEIDAPPDAYCTTRIIPVVADGQINQSNPTLPGNDVGAMNLQYTANFHTVGVFKFDVGANSTPTKLELILPHATKDLACVAPCGGPCTSLESPGTFRVYPMTSNWSEHDGADRGATWNCRRGPLSSCPTEMWFAPGATDPQDRGPQVGAFTSVVGTDAHVPLDPELTWMWKQQAMLSIQVSPDFNSGRMMVRAHENCEAGTAAAQLVLTYCQ